MEFYLKSKRNNYKAKLVYEDDSFVLKEGSTVSATVSTCFKSHTTVRKRRADNGIVDGNLIVKKDIRFKSSTAAGEFVCGSSCNGPSSWKTSDKITLKKWLQEQEEGAWKEE